MRRLRNVLALAFLGALLAACVLLPGRFSSDLAVRRDGTFSFTYKGELFLLPLSKLAQDAKDKEDAPFKPSPCTVDNTAETRPCSKTEVDDQRQTWEANRARRSSKTDEDSKMAQAFLGGLDPSDPRAAQEFADRLSRQAGWKSVVNKGDGRFEVEYAVNGRLDHDFSFPMIEKMPVATPFVTVIRRADGSVRIDAPAFSGGASGSPMMALIMQGAKEKGRDAALPQLDGTLTVRSDGEVLANNTDNGPQQDPAGKRLDWRVTARTAQAPTALIGLRTAGDN